MLSVSQKTSIFWDLQGNLEMKKDKRCVVMGRGWKIKNIAQIKIEIIQKQEDSHKHACTSRKNL